MTKKLTSEEEHAALGADLSKWRREAREWSGRAGRSRRDETAARLLDERAAAQDHVEDERRSNERAEENSDEGRQEDVEEMIEDKATENLKKRAQDLGLAGRLPAEKFGRDLVIKESDLKCVEDRKPGRPPKSAATRGKK